jgi:hypothetical protein
MWGAIVISIKQMVNPSAEKRQEAEGAAYVYLSK